LKEFRLYLLNLVIAYSIILTSFNYTTFIFNEEDNIDLITMESENEIHIGDSTSNIFIVDRGGNGDYTTINSALSVSSSGDVIRIWDGMYNESISINSPVDIIGNGSSKTVINGGNSGNVISVTSNSVNISNLKIINSGSSSCGLYLSSVINCILSDLVVKNNYRSIYLVGSSNNLIKNCDCSNNTYGIFLTSQSNSNQIRNNICNNMTTHNGILIWYSSNYNIIDENICNNNEGQGIDLYSSNYNNVSNNTCERNGNAGIWMWNSDDNEVSNCVTVDNGLVGIFQRDCADNFISHNIISSNAEDGIFFERSATRNIVSNCIIKDNMYHGVNITSNCMNNVIHHNNFINNMKPQGRDDGTNYWDNGTEGNYWSDLSIVDSDMNGINDVPYSIGGTGNSRDNYPLIDPISGPDINDSDNDGVLNYQDEFPNNSFEYKDTDKDGMGDNLDPDADNDGYPDTNDSFPLDRNEWYDTDKDGIGNNADTDDDNDGVPDSSDAFPLNPYEAYDSDSDGIGDNLDLDDNNNGINDFEEFNQSLQSRFDSILDQIDMMKNSMEDTLLLLNESIISTLTQLDEDFMEEIGTMNTELSEQIQSLMEAISVQMRGLNMSISSDLQHVELFIETPFEELFNELQLINSSLHANIGDLEDSNNNRYLSLMQDLEIIKGIIYNAERNITEYTLSELRAVLIDLAMNVTENDNTTKEMLLLVAGNIYDFESETLDELLKLNNIISDLEQLDLSLDQVKNEINSSIEDKGNEQINWSFLNIGLIVLIIILLIVVMILVLKGKKERSEIVQGEETEAVPTVEETLPDQIPPPEQNEDPIISSAPMMPEIDSYQYQPPQTPEGSILGDDSVQNQYLPPG